MAEFHICAVALLALITVASARGLSGSTKGGWREESAQDTLLEPAVLHPVHSVPQQRGRALWSKATAPFKYHGGQVMTSNVSVTMIYLGYTANDTVPAWLNWWIAYVGSTDWYRAIRWYYSVDNVTNVKTYANGNINLTASWYYDSTFASVNKINMTGSEVQVVWNHISKAIALQNNTPTTNDIYILVSADGVIPRDRNCSVRRAGGWHSGVRRTLPGTTTPLLIKFAFVPQDPCWSFARTDPATGTVVANTGYAPYGYDPALSPSGYPSIDSMATVLAHEVLETVTDPGTNYSPGWYGANLTEEAADVCSGYFRYPLLQGNTSTGAVYQYTDMVNGIPYFFPLTYLPTVYNVTGADFGCVFGVNGTRIVQLTNSNNTRWVWYGYTAPVPPPVEDYIDADYDSGKEAPIV